MNEDLKIKTLTSMLESQSRITISAHGSLAQLQEQLDKDGKTRLMPQRALWEGRVVEMVTTLTLVDPGDAPVLGG